MGLSLTVSAILATLRRLALMVMAAKLAFLASTSHPLAQQLAMHVLPILGHWTHTALHHQIASVVLVTLVLMVVAAPNALRTHINRVLEQQVVLLVLQTQLPHTVLAKEIHSEKGVLVPQATKGIQEEEAAAPLARQASIRLAVVHGPCVPNVLLANITLKQDVHLESPHVVLHVVPIIKVMLRVPHQVPRLQVNAKGTASASK